MEFPMPYILKPEPVWSGKQLVSFFMPKSLNINQLTIEDRFSLNDKSGLLIK